MLYFITHCSALHYSALSCSSSQYGLILLYHSLLYRTPHCFSLLQSINFKYCKQSRKVSRLCGWLDTPRNHPRKSFRKKVMSRAFVTTHIIIFCFLITENLHTFVHLFNFLLLLSCFIISFPSFFLQSSR